MTNGRYTGSGTRWTAGRKAELVEAVAAGTLTVRQIYRRYGISEEEFAEWQTRYALGGKRALRVTKYRDIASDTRPKRPYRRRTPRLPRHETENRQYRLATTDTLLMRRLEKRNIPGVAVPTREDGCWAEVRFNAGPNFSEFIGCGNPPRKGFLTCVKHQDRETAARELQAKSTRSRS